MCNFFQICFYKYICSNKNSVSGFDFPPPNYHQEERLLGIARGELRLFVHENKSRD